MLNVRVAASLCAVAFATAAGTAFAAPVRPSTAVARPGASLKTPAAKPITGFTIVHSFSGTDGGQPVGTMIESAHSYLFGVTEAGGAAQYGSIFRMNGHSGATNNVHTFSNTDGSAPAGGVVNSYGNLDLGGNFFGTTQTGGKYGYGTVWLARGSGGFKTLHSFTGGADGAQPIGNLLFFTDGNLYGTTSSGGASGQGTIFEITTAGALKTLYSFTGGSDGGAPAAGLSISFNGSAVNPNLFGSTFQGGANGFGTLFSISPSGTFTLLHTLSTTDGIGPTGELIPDQLGNLYGTATGGGPSFGGTIFKMTASGAFTSLYNFPINSSGVATNGSLPLAKLAGWSGNNLLGTTAFGGGFGAGTVFELNGTTLTVLHKFSGLDGQTPNGQLLISIQDGEVYGTTQNGGANGYGEVFALPLL